MMNASLQDTSFWEVWIEYDQFHPEYFGTLYVHGEILTDKNSSPSLIRMAANSNGELTLKLPERCEDVTCTREVVYSEPICNLNQYTSVAIYLGNELIDCFSDIEIMI